MGRLKEKLSNTQKALQTMEEIIKEPYSKIVRDAGIQRFEYTFEIFWKTLKEFLYEYDGIVINSPKSCFKEAFTVGLCDEEQTVKILEMTDDRNLTSHTYDEEIAERIYKKIPQYLELMKNILLEMMKKMER